MHSIASTHIHLLPIFINQFDNPCIVNHSCMHIKQQQILLASAMNKHDYIQYQMHSKVTTHIHLLTILIHQLDNPCIVNHSSMYIKQPQILLASALHKHAYIQYNMHFTASTHVHLLTILIQ
jgi:hypothetical protein